jgi:sister-chromatid-cohesion protein PDS5
MARWLLGLKGDELSAQKTFRMLNAFIVNQGDLLQQGKLRYDWYSVHYSGLFLQS